MDEARTSRYLLINARIAECEAALESIHQTNHKVNQLIALTKLLALKENMENA